MSPKDIELIKQQLEKYQNALRAVKMMEFEKVAPPDSAKNQTPGQPKLHYSDPVRAAIERNDVSFFRSCLEAFNEIEPNEYRQNLAKQSYISKNEFLKELEKFSTHTHKVDLQDKTNNLDLSIARAQETTLQQSPDNLSENLEPQSPVQRQEEEQQQSKQNLDKERESESHGQQTPSVLRETPHHAVPNSQRTSSPIRVSEEKLNKASQSMQQAQEQIRSQAPNAPRLSDRMSERLNSTTRTLRPQASMRNAPPRLRIRSRRPPIPVKPDRKRAAAIFLRKGATSGSGFGLPWAPKVLQNALNSVVRGAANIASNLLRGALNIGTRALMQILPRAAMQAGLGALRGLLLSAAGAAAAIVTTAAFWWLIALLSLLILTWWWAGEMDKSSNDGCAKPGNVEIGKMLKPGVDENKQFQVGENIEYEIVAVYNIRCTRATATLEIRDELPPNVTFVSAAAQLNRLPTDPVPSDERQAQEQGVLEGNTVVWRIRNILPERDISLSLVVTPTAAANDTWIMNQATVNFTETRPLGTPGVPGTGVINVQSASLQAVIDQAAQRVGMEPALMKAFIRVEAQAALSYSEEEFQFYSTPGWWEGLVDNASTRSGNDPIIIRGYGYNTCAYTGCAPGADVRGVTQFEIKTWEGIAKQLEFSDGHTPDRRNATDAIFGSALLNRENAEYYAGTPDFQWTEDVIRAAGRIYCGGKSAAHRKLLDGACMAGGKQYEDLLWEFYREYSGQ